MIDAKPAIIISITAPFALENIGYHQIAFVERKHLKLEMITIA